MSEWIVFVAGTVFGLIIGWLLTLHLSRKRLASLLAVSAGLTLRAKKSLALNEGI
jgi:hypothetical protein